jgi:hypothetical protein
MTAWTQKKHQMKYKKETDFGHLEPSNRMMVGAGDFEMGMLELDNELTPPLYEQAQRNDISMIRGRVSDHVSPGSYVSSSEDGSFHSTRIDEQPIGVSLGDTNINELATIISNYRENIIYRGVSPESGSQINDMSYEQYRYLAESPVRSFSDMTRMEQFTMNSFPRGMTSISIGELAFIGELDHMDRHEFEIKILDNGILFSHLHRFQYERNPLMLQYASGNRIICDLFYMISYTYSVERDNIASITIKGTFDIPDPMGKMNQYLEKLIPLTDTEKNAVYGHRVYQQQLEHEFQEANQDRLFESLSTVFYPHYTKFVHGVKQTDLNTPRFNGKYLLPEPPCELCQYFRKLLKRSKEVELGVFRFWGGDYMPTLSKNFQDKDFADNFPSIPKFQRFKLLL